MNILTITYIVIMALGVAWVIYRIIHYLRAERERDSVSQLMFSEEQFKAYLEDIRNQTKVEGGSVNLQDTELPPEPNEKKE